MPAIDASTLDPDKVVAVDIFSDETRQNWRSCASEWAQRPPFYVINHGIPQAVVSRHADVRAVLLDNERFTSTPPASASAHFDAFMGLPHLGAMNGAAHDRIRRILQPWFGGAAIARFEGEIERIVDELLDELEAGGDEFDCISEFSRQLIPRIMLGRMFGLDEARRAIFIRMNKELETVAKVGGYPTEYIAAFEQARHAIDEIIAERVENPTADFIGGLVAGRDRGEPISDDEIAAQVFAICAAAMTTTSTTTAMTLLAWMRHREQFDVLRSEPELAPAAVEESLRLHPAGLFIFPRFVAQDTELAGTRLWKDMPLHVCVAAANLDGEAYPDPLRFDIRRHPRHTVTFGAGRHFCAGAILARTTIATSLLAFMRRFPGLHLVDPDYAPVYDGQLGEVAPTEMRMRLR